MAQKSLIARAGKGLLGFFALLLRGIGAVCAACASIVLFAWANEDPTADSTTQQPREVDDDEAKSYGWKTW